MGIMNLTARQMTDRELRLAIDAELGELVRRWDPSVDLMFLEGLVQLVTESRRRAARVVVGYRVRTTDGTCVTRRGPHSVIATVAKPAPVSRADAYRIAADWLEAGYIPLVRRVMRRPT